MSFYKKVLSLLFFSFIMSAQCIAANSDSSWEQGFVDSHGVKIHYMGKAFLTEGRQSDSPSLLFIPGLSMPAWIFEKQLQHFSNKSSVFAMDPRSQGDSTQASEGQYAGARAADIKAVVDQLNLKPVVLVGWSLACSEIVSYLDQFGSDGIAGVVLIDGFVGCDLCSPIMPLLLQYWTEFQKNRIKNTPEFVEGMFLQPQPRNYLDKLAAASLITPTNTFMALVYNMLLTDLRPALPVIKTPTLIYTTAIPEGNSSETIISGTEDSKLPAAHAFPDFWLEGMREMHKLIPNSRLEIIENAGHALFVDQPEKFDEILEQFLEKGCLQKQL